MHAFTATLVLLSTLFCGQAAAGAAFNAPTGSTTWNASTPRVVKWRESGLNDNRTTLSMMGDVAVTLWAGSTTNGKTQVATLGQIAATSRELQVTIPTNVGDDGHVYFIHLQSLALPDRVYESHKFALTGMSGQFASNVTLSIQTGSNSTSASNSTISSSNSNSTRPGTVAGAVSGATETGAASTNQVVGGFVAALALAVGAVTAL